MTGPEPTIETLYGSITSVGFASGHRFVIGDWRISPIGPLADIMWALPDGRRVLLAQPRAAAYVASVYPFAEIRHQTVSAQRSGRRCTVRSGSLALHIEIGAVLLRLPPRPRWVTATVENRCARALLGVSTYGTSPTGVVEWYRTRTASRVVDASAVLDGTDLGPLDRVRRPLGFGFSDPPERPSHVSLRVDLRRPPALPYGAASGPSGDS